MAMAQEHFYMSDRMTIETFDWAYRGLIIQQLALNRSTAWFNFYPFASS